MATRKKVSPTRHPPASDAGPRSAIRDLRRQRMVELVTEILDEVGRQEREAGRAVADFLSGAESVLVDWPKPAPTRVLVRELAVRQDRLLALAREDAAAGAELGATLLEIDLAARPLECPLANLDEAGTLLERAKTQLESLRSILEASAILGQRIQVAAVNLALATLRETQENPAWIDHAERIRVLAEPLADGSRTLASRVQTAQAQLEKLQSTTSAGRDQTTSLAHSLAELSATRAGSAEELPRKVASRLGVLGDQALLASLSASELIQIEETARILEERAGSIVGGSRSDGAKTRAAAELEAAATRLSRTFLEVDTARAPGSTEELRTAIAALQGLASRRECDLADLVRIHADMGGLVRRQQAILSAIPRWADRLSSGLEEVAILAQRAGGNAEALESRVKSLALAALDIQNHLGDALRGFGQGTDEVLGEISAAADFPRSTWLADLLASATPGWPGEPPGAPIVVSLDALRRATRDAVAAGGRADQLVRAADWTIRHALSILAACKTSLSEWGARAIRAAGALARNRDRFATLGESIRSVVPSLVEPRDWASEALPVLDRELSRLGARSSATRDAARAGSRLELALAALAALADELDRIVPLA